MTIYIEIWAFFAKISSKFNETTSFQSNYKDNLDSFHIIKSTNFISHRIEIKICNLSNHRKTNGPTILTDSVYIYISAKRAHVTVEHSSVELGTS